MCFGVCVCVRCGQTKEFEMARKKRRRKDFFFFRAHCAKQNILHTQFKISTATITRKELERKHEPKMVCEKATYSIFFMPQITNSVKAQCHLFNRDRSD